MENSWFLCRNGEIENSFGNPVSFNFSAKVITYFIIKQIIYVSKCIQSVQKFFLTQFLLKTNQKIWKIKIK